MEGLVLQKDMLEAARAGRGSVVAHLLALDKYQETPLHVAAAKGHDGVAQLLSVLSQAMREPLRIEQSSTSQLPVEMPRLWRDCLHTILP